MKPAVLTIAVGAVLLALTGCVTGDRQVDALVETGAWAAWHAVMW